MTTTRAPFLTQKFGAYHHRDVPEADHEMAQVGPGTPCGEYFRRFWQPVVMTHELKDLPIRMRILGEDLVVFKDKSGQIGAMELHCPHRGTSLEFGIVSERGLRCCYHGWLFNVDGRILETPGEPADSTLKDRLCHGAYPVHEYKGLVFVYMGPPEKKPPFPVLDTYGLDGYQMIAGPRYDWPCNWLQVKENSMDAAHLIYLHTLPGSMGFTQDLAIDAEWDYMETPAGTVYIDTRRKDDKVWIRIADFIPPNIHQFPPNLLDIEQRTEINHPMATTWTVPLDDTNTMQIGFHRTKEGGPFPMRTNPGFGQDASRPYEERQRTPGDYDAQVNQRTIAVHALEHLASTDRGVSMLRNMVRRGMRLVQDGADVHSIGVEGDPAPTYAHDIVLEVPAAATLEADGELLRDLGRRQVNEWIERKPRL